MIRGVGLRGAIAVNVITMIGIGPLITIPLVVASLHGGLALWGWIVGAIIALCDGLVWAELSSRFPGSGGTYVYLREAFGRDRWGRLFAFLFNWQFIFFAPLLLASGYIGFAQYAAYFFPLFGTSILAADALKIGLGILVIALLYQRITSVAKISIVLGVTAVLTLLCVIAASIPHANLQQALSTDMHASFQPAFIVALGAGLVFTVYDYVGYADVALIGDEVIEPNRTIPLAIILSVLLVATLYIVMQIGVLGVVPWQSLVGINGGPPPDAAQYVASTVVATTWGRPAALVVTILVLITAFASLYGNLLGFSRIPFAAARDRIFFPVFAHLHKAGAFPNVSLLVIGIASIVAAFLPLGEVIAYLTAGIVIIQGVAQIVALFVLRAKHERAPFRMWLFPVPAIVAFVGWAYLFYSTGNKAMLFGALTLLAGLVAFALLAQAQRTWPFVAALTIALCVCAGPATASYGHSAVVQQNGYPVFEVDRKPFFVYGAAFFYERLPKEQWRPSLVAYKAMGINTIDLYLIWNWHELRDGDYDFTGRTNPRHDLHALFSMIHELGFKTIIRPGPVIRNEWKNGGYPDWLLRRPEYNMPLHDVLEGRYPATATLQNAHSDDAAAEWMNNKTHMQYAPRWLRRVLTEIKPWSNDVIAIALDDDQGAYIDNQTWPAPRFQAYIKFLNSVVHSVAPGVPTFINTYQMKVTASAPVWAWGNWYQSDAFSLGEHDRSQLEFSTALLQTQPAYPVMVSEFQAGWLQGPDETRPRAADPTNTELAIGTMLQVGAHGIVNFPVQDSWNPSGYEAPFANMFYSWDAALSPELTHQARYAPTERMGQLIRAFGSLLAQTHRVADAAILWTPASVDPSALTNKSFYDASAKVISALQWCRSNALTCDLLDAHFADKHTKERYRTVLDPNNVTLDAALAQQLRANSALPDGTANVTLLAGPRERYGFLVVTNYDATDMRAQVVRVRLAGHEQHVALGQVPARSVGFFPIGVARAASQPRSAPLSHNVPPLGGGGTLDMTLTTPATLRDRAQSIAISNESGPEVILRNDDVEITILPNAGARVLGFSDRDGHNVFTTIGGLRDDVAAPLPPSTRDYIAKYTHQFPAGTFNRSYDAQILQSGPEVAEVRLSYQAPDLDSHAVTFSRVITLKANSRTFQVAYEPDASTPTRSISSITAGDRDVQELGSVETGGVALFNSKTGTLATVSWRQSDITDGTFTVKPDSAVVILVLKAGATRPVTFGNFTARDATAAQMILDAMKGR